MMPLHFVENVRDRLIEKGLADAAELDEAMAALKRHLDDPNTLVVSSVFVQAWGRKP